jgi:hypothetical protein
MKIGAFAIPVALLLAWPAQAASLERPGSGGVTTIAELPGWWHAGTNPTGYSVTVDRAIRHGGSASARLTSTVKNPKGFGSLMQVASASGYIGKRVRLSAWLKATGVQGRAGLWLRVDGRDQDPNRPIVVDVMGDRPIVGTRDWQRYEIVLDVAKDAADIAYGAHISGEGSIWVDDLKFEVVDQSVATTAARRPPSAPQNLNFEGR